MPDTLLTHIKKIITLLKLIYSSKSLSITDIVNVTGFNRTQVYKLLEVLEELGLIKRERIRAVPPRTIVTLTDKGSNFMKCVEQTIDVDTLLSNSK
ncbi:MAG: helix-turn-helix domain-containing protein [Staphylothermus sp.]|nr:helix-turn-helix domain-containing protein [Staphylothermus sp.]